MAQSTRSNEPSPLPIRTECFMLCDHVREDNGKLYILGGGWDHIEPADLPAHLQFQLAIKLVVPLELAGRSLTLALEVLDQHGDEIDAGVDEITLVPDEPPAADHRPEIAIVLPVHVSVDVHCAASYRIRLTANRQEVASTRFSIREPAPSSAR